MKFSQCCCETSVIQIQQIKVKTIFLDKNSKKTLLYNKYYIGQLILSGTNKKNITNLSSAWFAQRVVKIIFSKTND